jgi:hypothetical protein
MCSSGRSRAARGRAAEHGVSLLMNALSELQKWYIAQCDGDWEHQSGVTISTLDNPGWSVTIDLEGTTLSGKNFGGRQYGIEHDAATSGNNWFVCETKDNKFEGRGGPEKLEEMLTTFLRWANEAG